MAKQTAQSNLLPQHLWGEIVRWIDDDHFIIRIGCREIIGNKQYWRITDGEE